MDIFDVLSFDERIIVYSSEEDQVVITWNQSLTLQCWGYNGDDWTETATQTLSKEPRNYEEARQAAIHWYTGG